MRRTIVIVLLLLAVAAAAAWWAYGRPVEVTLVPAATGTAAEIVYASGTVEPTTWARVTPLVRGRIVEVCNCEGEIVEPGYLLVRLDDSEVQARQRELEARLELAERELDRAEGLLERNFGSQQASDRAVAEVGQIRASLAAVNQQLSEYRVTAPIGGQVLRLDASVGEIAEPGTALAYVGQPRPLEVVAEVNEEDIPRVDIGQSVLIRSDAFGNRVLTGTVSQITPMGDPVQRTYRVRIALPEDTPLFIGMSVDANIVIRESGEAVVIPVAGLEGDRVYVIDDGTLSPRSVTVGIRGIDTVEVVDGLAPGELIVVPVPDDARPGLKVTASQGPGDVAAREAAGGAAQ